MNTPRTLVAKIRSGLAAAAQALSALAATAATPAAVPSGPVVNLPPLEVSASAPWLYVEAPNVEVLSRCSERTTREFLAAELRLAQVLQLLVPEQFQAKFSTPRQILLSNQGTTPSSAREVIAGFSPREGKPATQGDNPAGPGGGAPQPTVRFMPNLRLDDHDGTTVFAFFDEDEFDAPTLKLTRSYVRMLLERRTPPLPAWFIEGVIALFDTAKFEPNSLTLPPAEWPATEADALRGDAAHPRTLLSLPELLAFAPPAGDAAAAAAVERWRAQSALLVRWALDDEEGRRRAALWKFVALASAGPVDEAALRVCFGRGSADIRDELSDYLPDALRNKVVLRLEKPVRVSVPRPRLATEAEIGRLKGDWERLELLYVQAHHPEYAPRYLQQARRTFARVREHAERDPRLLAATGLFECDTGNPEAARPLLEAAAQAKVVRPRVYVELARMRCTEALANPAGPNGRLSPEQANHVLAPLAVAREQAPPLADSFLLAAEAWGRSNATLSAVQLDLLEEGLRLFPADARLLCEIAIINVLIGRPEEAANLAARGLQAAQDSTVRERLERLQSALAAQAGARTSP